MEATEGGTAGNLTVKTGHFTISEGARVTVSSPTGQAGNVKITANFLSLDRGEITAETGVGQDEEGANITLNVPDLLQMRNESLISAEAFETADGGNIDIDARFLVAFPSNNRIIANAFEGQGGNITINTFGIFGFPEFLEIDASSEFGVAGIVEINNPDVDISRQVVETPEVVEPEVVEAQACPTDGRVGEGASSFTITGRGGLPPSASDPLTSDGIRVGGVSTAQNNENRAGVVTKIEQANPPSMDEIVPAQGLMINDKGEVVLTSHPTPNTSQRSLTDPASCQL